MEVALVAAWVVIGLAALVLRPYIPSWVAFTLSVGFVVYGLVRIMNDGPDAEDFALIAFFGAGAAYVWWRDLRREALDRRQQGP